MIGSGEKTHSEFGDRLRNWLELVIRFTNIPCRIQCSRELQMPDQDNMTYVAKLVIREGQYCRLINQDKTSSTHQPLVLPLGRTISAYLYFYITHCRTTTDQHSYVFSSGSDHLGISKNTLNIYWVYKYINWIPRVDSYMEVAPS